MGNTRVTFKPNTTNNGVVRVEYANYFPFGMKMLSPYSSSSTNKYLYNGKEMQERFIEDRCTGLLPFGFASTCGPALEKLTGINQKQLHHYASGLKKPRLEQRKKIEKAFHNLGNELLTIQL